MRKFCILFSIISIFGANILYAQPVDSGMILRRDSLKLVPEGVCITPEQRERSRARTQRNIDSLRAIGKLPQEFPESRAVLELQWPISSTLSDYGYHRMGHFPDHNNTAGLLEDYMCGNRTYDRGGYDHWGTDIFGWPFDWHKMDNNEVQVIAAAPGVIIDKDDGNYDRECATIDSGNTYPNSIKILQSDGSRAWYAHIKMNSLTSKRVGDTVQTGEYLGIMGSSGWSWEPHLHFELVDMYGDMVDPNVGDCNQNPSIRWADGVQPPYYDSAINKVMTHSAPPDFNVPCPTPAIINEKNDFTAGDTLYVAGYYRDQLSGQTAQYTIYKPDDAVFQTWSHHITEDFPHPSIYRSDWANASHWWWAWSLPSDSPGGIWRVEVVYESKTYEHYFNVNRPPVMSAIAGQIMNEGETLNIGVSSTDPDSNSITLTANLPSFGNLIDNGDGTGTISFAPGFNVAGVYSNIEVIATDDGSPSLSDTVVFALTVNDRNGAPSAVDDVDITAEDTAITINVLVNDSDPDGDTLTVTGITQGNNGTAIKSDSSVIYTPNSNFNGTDTLTYFISDGNGGTDSAMVTVTVNPVNDLPVMSSFPDSVVFDADTSVTLNVWNFVEDVETPDSLLDYRFSADPESLDFNYNDTTGFLKISSLSGFKGEAKATIMVTDLDGGEASDSLLVIVHTPPVGISDPFDLQIPQEFALMQNYPNPFNPVTNIRFGLPEASRVLVEVYNMLGQRVVQLIDERKPAGYHVVQFDGSELGSGFYFYRIQADHFNEVRKMLLMK
jgi:murein DD-endopeptidase MepM/ murein hydrolase activator NlpD